MKSVRSLSYSKFSYRLEDREDDVHLSLGHRCSSDLSKSFIDKLIDLFSKQEGWKYRVGEPFKQALEGYVFSLLSLPLDDESIWLRRSLRPKSFKGSRVGFKPVTKAHKAFKNAGFIEVKLGVRTRDIPNVVGIATRSRPTVTFLALAAENGLNNANCSQHFSAVQWRSKAVVDPVRRRARKPGDYRNPLKGELLPVDLNNPKAAAAAAQVQRLNAWFAGVHIEGCTFEGFYRLFNLGDQPDFDFNKGGRLYTEGDYQRIKRHLRSGIRLNGERTVEVDVSGSHITILHAMLGVPLFPGADPYANCGIDRRNVVKRWVTMTLGHDCFQRSWSKDVRIAYLKDDLGIEREKKSDYTKEELGWLQRDYPIAKVRKAVLDALPLLKGWLECPITWADLQYRESLGLIATVEALAFEHGIPALPLHDSVIVPVSKAVIAEQVLKEQFWKEAGVRIGVKVKG